MNQLVSVFIGNQANKIIGSYYYFESQQIFDTEDPTNHSCLFSDIEKKQPRFISICNKRESEIINYQNYIDYKKIGVENKKVDTAWKKNLNVVKDEDSLKMNETNPYYDQIKTLDFKKKHILELEQKFEGQFDTFLHGDQQYMNNQDDFEQMENLLRIQLEENDFIGGFQFFVDNDGFSSVGRGFLELIRDECSKKNFIYFPLWDQNKSKFIQNMNRVYSLTQTRELVDLLVPFNLRQIQNFGDIDQNLNFGTPFNEHCVVAPFLSNLTLPYRLQKNTLDSYTKQIINYNDQNIFDYYAAIPRIGDPSGSDIITRLAEAKIFSNLNQKYSKSYSLGFMLRGIIDLPEQPPLTQKFNIQMIGAVYQMTPELPFYLSEGISKFYIPPKDKSQDYSSEKEQNLEKLLPSLPFQTCISSHDGIATVLSDLKQEILNSQDKSQMLTRLETEGYTRDDFSETLNQIENLWESYNSKNEEGNMDEF